MKIKFITKLTIIIIIVILAINIVFVSEIEARDNTTYIMASKYYLGNTADYMVSKLPFWYRRLNYNVIKNIDPNTTQFWESLYADVQYLHGHGDWDRFWSKDVGIIVGNGREYDGIYHFGTNDVHWDTDTLLVVYSACLTSKDNNPNGLAAKTCEKGADNVIGWRNSIWSDDAAYWSENFAQALAVGYGVYDAAAFANSKSYPQDDVNNTAMSIKNNTVWNHGEPNMKLGSYRSNAISLNTSKNDLLEDSRNILKNVKQSVEFKNVEEIIDIIKNYDASFNKTDYIIKESEGIETIDITNGHKTKQSIIDFNLKLGEFYTNAGYVAVINGGKVKAIYDNTLPVKNKKDKFTESNFKVNESIKNGNNNYKKIATEEAIKKANVTNAEDYNIIEQKQSYYYDVETGKKFVRVRTKIETEWENKKINDYTTSLFEI